IYRNSALYLNAHATSELHTLSLHDALPILECGAAVEDEREGVLAQAHDASRHEVGGAVARAQVGGLALPVHVEVHDGVRAERDRSEEHTLNSSHVSISYAVFCLKKKRKTKM